MAGLRDAAKTMTAEELAKLEKNDPYKHFLLTTPYGQAICGVAAELPAHLRDSAEWEISIQSASPELRAAVEDLLTIWRKQTGQTAQGEAYPFDPSKLTIAFELNEQNDADLVVGFYGRLEIGGAEIPLIGKNSSFRNWYAKQMKAMGSGSKTNPDETVLKFLDPAESLAVEDRRILAETVEIDRKHCDDYAAWLEAIHRKTGWTVLSDYYWENVGEVGSRVAIKEILQRMALANKDLAYDESVLLITNNRWYKKRLADIPDEYLAYYTAKARESGLTLDDLKRIALDLSTEQIVSHLLEMDIFSAYRSFLANPRQLAGMRFIACLTEAQKIRISVARNDLESPSTSGPFAAELAADELPAKATQYTLEAVGKDANYIVGKTVTFSHYSEPEPLGPNLQFIYVRMNIMDAEGNRESLPFGVTIPGIDWFDRTKPKAADSK